ncbi:MAG: hypothetical protein HY860_03015, partial [Chlamydiales bacterium]|nr:hypothetical protein [Chlamydiales bacterium]
GKKFFYDFLAKQGYVIEGKTSDGLWIIGGATLLFLPDRSVQIKNAFATTSDDSNTKWDFHASELSLQRDMQLSAKHITFRSSTVPVLYVPYYSTNLKKKSDSPFSYSATWDTGQGPMLSMRYRAYETETFDLFTRLDYRVTRGGGGAIETDYESLSRKLKILTKSYIAHDTFVQDPNPNAYKTRYRFQGLADGKKIDECMDIFMRYDYISDRYMPNDFPSDSFEISTAKRTELVINRVDPSVTTNLYIRPRINDFQGFKQEIPTLRIGVKPFEMFGSGIMFDNFFKIAYLDYDYSEEMTVPVNVSPPPTFRSGRFQTSQYLYRPLDMEVMILTPKVGYNGIYYTNNQNSEATALSSYLIGFDASSSLYKNFSDFGHVITPYANFDWIKTTNQLSNHFIFSIEDGVTNLHQLHVGIKNDFYPKKSNTYHPLLSVDLYSYGFFSTSNLPQKFPFLYLDATLYASRMSFTSNLKWDYNVGKVAQFNTSWKWTISNRLAFSAEVRNRSNYEIRKCDPFNFFVDVANPFEQEITSPLADPRTSFLLKAQANLTPFTFIRAESHIGWGRPAPQPAYTETKIDFFTMIATNWRLRVSYQHSVFDDQVAFGISMIPFKK